jgi:ubiquinone/menaquinone biosynthesis C-methylase UbiE
MKGRESGMPDEAYWNSFFDAEAMLNKLLPIDNNNVIKLMTDDIAEIGSGYGTFTLSAAKMTSGLVHAFDIETELVETLTQQCHQLGFSNIKPNLRDILAEGSGLADNSLGHVMIYNLLHIEQPELLLKEARRILKPDGTVSVIHWRSDIETPRGPSMDIRPTTQQCIEFGEDAGFTQSNIVDLGESAPYHFGLILNG